MKAITTARTTRLITMSAVAASLLAGCGGGDDPSAADAATPTASSSIEVEAGDLYFDPESLAAPAGTIEFTLVNVGAAEHDLVIEEADDAVVVFAAPGETVSGSIDLEAGTYTYYCSIPGHRSGMEGTLEVS